MTNEIKPQARTLQYITGLMSCCGDMQCFDRLCAIAYHVIQTDSVTGEIGEFGCFQGYTARVIAALTTKRVHLYDSFEGLPEMQPPDAGSAGWFHKGHLKTAAQTVVDNFIGAGLPLPEIHQGWFKDFKPEDFPASFSFVHVDGDFYSSIKDALAQAYPRLSPGGVMLIDDYDFCQLPGAKIATDEFFADKPEKPVQLYGLGGTYTHQAMVVKGK